MENIVVYGCGIVGKYWAMLFASKGHRVRLYDINPEVTRAAPALIRQMLLNFESKGQLKGNLSAEEQMKLIEVYEDLSDALRGCTYIQENAPEILSIKIEAFTELDKALRAVGNEQAIIGSSTSTLLHSDFAKGLEIAKRSLVVHPINPVYFIRYVELVPSAGTGSGVCSRVRDLMEGLGMKPVVLNKEIAGFALNRIQYVILNETWRLVEAGVISAADADIVMKEGLAPRYIFMGPLETSTLNAYGFMDYITRYGPSIKEITSSPSMTRVPEWDRESGKDIDRQIQEQLVSNENLDLKRKQRDEKLGAFTLFKKELGL